MPTDSRPLPIARRRLLQAGAGLSLAAPLAGWPALRAAADPTAPSKTRSTYYTAERVANARANIDRYGWARQQRDAAVTAAAEFTAHSDAKLWDLVTPQSVSRSLGVLIRYRQRIKGSPGPEGAEINKFGNYPWRIDAIGDPWKLKSPVTGERYPSNDFASFYAAGLNEHGIFDVELARERGSQFLINELYPERGEGWGVDDGSGWTDPDGDTWTFVAYYHHWALWTTGGGQAFHGYLIRALNALRDAYLFTGQAEYAHKGLILLDRMADVWPDMDVTAYPWEGGFDNGDPAIHTAQGKVVNDIWETGIARVLLQAYDAFYPAIETDPAALEFIQAQAEKYKITTPKTTPAELRAHFEDHIVRLVYPAVQGSQIRGNTGMHQSVLALAAVIMDEEGTSKEWLDYVWQPGDLVKITDPAAPYGRRYEVTGGNMARVLIDQIDRDGWGNEAAPGYNSGWLGNFLQLADAVDGFQRYPDYDLFEHPKFLKMFTAIYPIAMLSRYTPSIGDSGNTGGPGIVGALATDLLGFGRTKDPGLAQLVHLRNGNTTTNLRGNIFEAEPEAVVAEIQAIVDDRGRFNPGTVHQPGYGFAALREGSGAAARGAWLYYGRSSGHGHRDTLNLGLHAAGMDLTPDLGYPEVTGLDPERQNWTMATVSHNTVVVDESSQAAAWVAVPRLIAGSDRVQLIEVDAPKAYARTELYRRTTTMITIDDQRSYLIDFFRVDGGDDHVFSFHGAKGTVTTNGLELVDQTSGSYAGPEVPFQDPKYNQNGKLGGFNYLNAVQRDASPASPYRIDWKIADNWNVHDQDPDAHLRLTMLSPVDDVALADGVPPRNKPGNPDKLRYLLAHRHGSDLKSNFVSVIEPTVGASMITASALVPVRTEDGDEVDHFEVAAVKIDFADGRTDYVVSAISDAKGYVIDGSLQFRGRFGVCTLRAGEPEHRFLHDCRRFGPNASAGPRAYSKLEGKVVDFTRELTMENTITVDVSGGKHGPRFDPKTLIGSYLHVQTDNVRNGTYKITGATMESINRFVLEIGDQTLIRSLLDPDDANGGYTYDLTPNTPFTLPLTETR
ncbi:heparinase II/III domain-containing protein [Microlunatus speluncae]|uniref:heparinase II/III domain-containing protein n=1 Tax=Microlunatus speluncae TaxID=2594267 RepID=UPI0012663CC4|nr:heparinase II/III family protein [Microlunatus speluncae]